MGLWSGSVDDHLGRRRADGSGQQRSPQRQPQSMSARAVGPDAVIP